MPYAIVLVYSGWWWKLDRVLFSMNFILHCLDRMLIHWNNFFLSKLHFACNCALLIWFENQIGFCLIWSLWFLQRISWSQVIIQHSLCRCALTTILSLVCAFECSNNHLYNCDCLGFYLLVWPVMLKTIRFIRFNTCWCTFSFKLSYEKPL